MQEEVENRSVTLAISATKLSARVLRSAIAKLLAEWQKSRDAPAEIPHGEPQRISSLTSIQPLKTTSSSPKQNDLP